MSRGKYCQVCYREKWKDEEYCIFHYPGDKDDVADEFIKELEKQISTMLMFSVDLNFQVDPDKERSILEFLKEECDKRGCE